MDDWSVTSEIDIGDEMKMKGTNKKMDAPQPLRQLRTPEQNGGAAQIDALMTASAEGFK